jgi:hypothetical protein
MEKKADRGSVVARPVSGAASSSNGLEAKVGAGKHGQVGGNEIPPSGFLAPFGRRRDPISAKDVPHRLIRDGMAEIGQRSDNSVISPPGVPSGDADN